MQKVLKGYWDQLFIDKMVLQEVKRKKKNLAMGWINYWKPYKLAQSWGIESLNMIGIAKNVVNLLGKTIRFWRVELTFTAETLAEVPIKKDIFQGDALLFVITLIPLTHILRAANPRYEMWTGDAINNLLFMDDLKLYSKSEKALDFFTQTVRIFSEDIGIWFAFNICVMLW